MPNVHLNNKSSDKCCNEEINVISSKMLFSCSVVSDSLQPPWTAARQASQSFTVYQSWLKPMFTESVMPSNHLIFCCPLLLLSSIFPSIRIFSNESTLCIRWPKCWSFSFSTSPSNVYSGLNTLVFIFFWGYLFIFYLVDNSTFFFNSNF